MNTLAWKLKNLCTIKNNLLKSVVNYGSVVSGIRDPLLFSFSLSKPTGIKVFRELETMPFKKVCKSILNAVTFYLQNNNLEEVNSNVETLTFA